ncbi:HAMP domain-containing sensor histidine kinase [Deinococcus rubellus]|uniref:histidine kinase n=1 Tax=Deinococcus rubellus TaxID=1889240 RepID=A0ABY5YJZ6_9DEIO|nr:HAMP domain-containing sensor histidine kinase [Deinococcus rubellus]UWX65435.1 HAMP domain-containing histidine kinase [Deinococcus rubellus]
MTASQFSFQPERWNTLRAQFAAVIFALAFLPNLTLTLIVSGGNWSLGLTLWTLGVGVLSAVIGYVLAAAMLGPLIRLRAEVEQDDVEVDGPAGDPGEVRALRSAFTGLLLRLGTEQARRGAFMATLVHDLKTPLIATGHLTRLLIGTHLSEPERLDVGGQMLAENARLLALVQQMADAHRFERDAVQLSKRPTELRPLLDVLAARLSAAAAARGVMIRVGGQALAEVDAAVLERALLNLTDNALRYAATEVRLEVRQVGTAAELSVSDDGPGLSGALDELAQPFNAQPTTIAGQQYTAGTAGLGLFIARRIAQAHGGDLHYHRQPAPDLLTGLPDSPPSARLAAPAQDLSVLTLILPEVSHETRDC